MEEAGKQIQPLMAFWDVLCFFSLRKMCWPLARRRTGADFLADTLRVQI